MIEILSYENFFWLSILGGFVMFAQPISPPKKANKRSRKSKAKQKKSKGRKANKKPNKSQPAPYKAPPLTAEQERLYANYIRRRDGVPTGGWWVNGSIPL